MTCLVGCESRRRSRRRQPVSDAQITAAVWPVLPHLGCSFDDVPGGVVQETALMVGCVLRAARDHGSEGLHFHAYCAEAWGLSTQQAAVLIHAATALVEPSCVAGRRGRS